MSPAEPSLSYATTCRCGDRWTTHEHRDAPPPSKTEEYLVRLRHRLNGVSVAVAKAVEILDEQLGGTDNQKGQS